MDREKFFQELLEADSNRQHFSEEKWKEWTIIFCRIIGPEMHYNGICDTKTYVIVQDIWLKSGISDALDYLDAQKAVKEFK